MELEDTRSAGVHAVRRSSLVLVRGTVARSYIRQAFVVTQSECHGVIVGAAGSRHGVVKNAMYSVLLAIHETYSS